MAVSDEQFKALSDEVKTLSDGISGIGETIANAVGEAVKPLKDHVEALDAALTATSLDDLAGAVVNNDFVERAGLDFDDALAQDDPDDTKALPYANVFAAQADDLDDPTYQRLVEIYQETQAVQEGVVEVSGGTAVMLDTPVEDLRAILAEVESDTRDQQG